MIFYDVSVHVEHDMQLKWPYKDNWKILKTYCTVPSSDLYRTHSEAHCSVPVHTAEYTCNLAQENLLELAVLSNM